MSACAAPVPTTTDTSNETTVEEAQASRGTLCIPYQLWYGAATNLDPTGPVRIETAIIMLYELTFPWY